MNPLQQLKAGDYLYTNPNGVRIEQVLWVDTREGAFLTTHEECSGKAYTHVWDIYAVRNVSFAADFMNREMPKQEVLIDLNSGTAIKANGDYYRGEHFTRQSLTHTHYPDLWQPPHDPDDLRIHFLRWANYLLRPSATIHGFMRPDCFKRSGRKSDTQPMLVQGGCMPLRWSLCQIDDQHLVHQQSKDTSIWTPPEVETHGLSADPRKANLWSLAKLALHWLKASTNPSRWSAQQREFWQRSIDPEPSRRPLVEDFVQFISTHTWGYRCPWKNKSCCLLELCDNCARGISVAIPSPTVCLSSGKSLPSLEIAIDARSLRERSQVDLGLSQAMLLIQSSDSPSPTGSMKIWLSDTPYVSLADDVPLFFIEKLDGDHLVGRSALVVTRGLLVPDRLKLTVKREHPFEEVSMVGVLHDTDLPDTWKVGQRLDIRWTGSYLPEIKKKEAHNQAYEASLEVVARGLKQVLVSTAKIRFLRRARLDPVGVDPLRRIFELQITANAYQHADLAWVFHGSGEMEILTWRIQQSSLHRFLPTVVLELQSSQMLSDQNPEFRLRMRFKTEEIKEWLGRDALSYTIYLKCRWKLSSIGLEEIVTCDWPVEVLFRDLKPFDGVVAIDFGATNFCIAATQTNLNSGNNLMEVSMLPRKRGHRALKVDSGQKEQKPEGPTVIARREEELGGGWFWGDEAAPHHGAFEGFKACLGSQQLYRYYSKDAQGRVNGSHSYSADELCLEFFLQAIDCLIQRDELNAFPQQLVLTAPVNHSYRQRRAFAWVREQLIEYLVRRIGSNQVRIREIDEATAVALYYLHQHLGAEALETSSLIWVLDIGGSTSDIAALHLEPNQPEGRDELPELEVNMQLAGQDGMYLLGGSNATLEILLALVVNIVPKGFERDYPIYLDTTRAQVKLPPCVLTTDNWLQLSLVDQKIALGNGNYLFALCEQVKQHRVDNPSEEFYFQRVYQQSGLLPAEESRQAVISEEAILEAVKLMGADAAAPKSLDQLWDDLFERLDVLIRQTSQRFSSKSKYLIVSGHSARLKQVQDRLKTIEDRFSEITVKRLDPGECKHCVASGAHWYGWQEIAQQNHLAGLTTRYSFPSLSKRLSFAIGERAGASGHSGYAVWIKAGARLITDLSDADLAQYIKNGPPDHQAAVSVKHDVILPEDKLMLWEVQTQQRVADLAIPDQHAGSQANTLFAIDTNYQMHFLYQLDNSPTWYRAHINYL